MFRTSGKEELESKDGVHKSLASLQSQTAFLPDYSFKKPVPAAENAAAWPAIDKGRSLSGLVGGMFTLLLAGLAGFVFARRKTAA
jgi:cobalt/nickel transport system permease protein